MKKVSEFLLFLPNLFIRLLLTDTGISRTLHRKCTLKIKKKDILSLSKLRSSFTYKMIERIYLLYEKSDKNFQPLEQRIYLSSTVLYKVFE